MGIALITMGDIMNINEKIANMTSNEIRTHVMGDAPVDKPVAMDGKVAFAILNHPAYDVLDERLKEWAWNSV